MPPFVQTVGSLMQQMQLDPLPLDRFLGDDLQECRWSQEYKRGLAKSWKGKDGGVKARTTKPVDEYQVDNLQAFESVGIPWPPTYDEVVKGRVEHLCDRKQKAVWYHEHRLLQEQQNHESSDEFVVDLNMSCNWQLVQKNFTPCIVSTSTLWLLRRQRYLQPEEALALQGFPQTILQECDPPLTCKQLTDLAGNAFNGAICVALAIALTVGTDWKLILSKMRAFQLTKAANDGALDATEKGEDAEQAASEHDESEEHVSSSDCSAEFSWSVLRLLCSEALQHKPPLGADM